MKRRLAFLLAAAAGSAGLASPVAAEPHPHVTAPARITVGDDTPTRTYSSPSLAVDPENPQTVVAAYAEMRTARCSVARSKDGGRTWKRLMTPPALPSYPMCFTPSSSNVPHAQVAFGRNHRLYLAMAGWDSQDQGRTSVLVARSPDLGTTWATTLVHDVRGKPEPDAENDRPVSTLAVDRRGPDDVVYVGWTRRLVNVRPFRAGSPVIATSTDGGRTFSQPITVVGAYFADETNLRAVLQHATTALPPGVAPTPPGNINADRFGGTNPLVAIGRNGTVFALWRLESAGLAPAVPPALFLSRSDDGGRTFKVVGQVTSPTGALVNMAFGWTPAGGPEGTLHVVHEDKRPLLQGDRDIFYKRSTDGGRTWSDPRQLNDEDPKLLAAQFLPSMTTRPDGRIDVAWWDFRNDTGAFLNDTYLTSSPDNGTTWLPNVRVTERSIDRKLGPWSNGYDVRQPPGLAAMERYSIVAWDDTRNADPEGQAQDLYRALVQFRSLPAPTSPALVYLFAAVVGVLLAGLVVTMVGFANRRRSRRSPGAPEKTPLSATGAQ